MAAFFVAIGVGLGMIDNVHFFVVRTSDWAFTTFWIVLVAEFPTVEKLVIGLAHWLSTHWTYEVGSSELAHAADLRLEEEHHTRRTLYLQRA